MREQVVLHREQGSRRTAGHADLVQMCRIRSRRHGSTPRTDPLIRPITSRSPAAALAPKNTDRLVDDYLRRLDAAAAILPPSRRSELVAEIREHIESALHDAGAGDEVAVHNVLERLGSPEEIAAEASDEPPLSMMSTPMHAGPSGIPKLVAAAALAIVSILAVIGALTPGPLGSLERGVLLVVVFAGAFLAWQLAMPSR